MKNIAGLDSLLTNTGLPDGKVWAILLSQHRTMSVNSFLFNMEACKVMRQYAAPLWKLIPEHANTDRGENRGQEGQRGWAAHWWSSLVSPGRTTLDVCWLWPASSGCLGYHLATTLEPRTSTGPSALEGRSANLHGDERTHRSAPSLTNTQSSYYIT